MSAVMVILMDITDDSWIVPYFANVGPLLARYSAVPLAGSRRVTMLEGVGPAPDRIATIRFPSLDHIDRFMADPEYQRFRVMREAGSSAKIFVFEDDVMDGALA